MASLWVLTGVPSKKTREHPLVCRIWRPVVRCDARVLWAGLEPFKDKPKGSLLKQQVQHVEAGGWYIILALRQLSLRPWCAVLAMSACMLFFLLASF